MNDTSRLTFLKMLSKDFPTIGSVCTEIINLQAILDLPKSTEHYISDLHGESEAVAHILNNASGIIREKINELYTDSSSDEERAELATLIYYPERKLVLLKKKYEDHLHEWYHMTLVRLIEVCRVVSSKYTRSKVRKVLPPDFSYIIDELLHADHFAKNKEQYYGRIVETIIDVDRADAFIVEISSVIKRLAVDRLHILGDIYDRGPGAEDIMDMLEEHPSLDIVWGNHDIIWMAAFSGCEAAIANVLNISLKYANVDTLENGYGISLRALTLFAEKTYGNSMAFKPKVLEEGKIGLNDVGLVAKLRKAVAIIQLKLEGQIISRHPEYDMDDRMLLHKIDFDKGTVDIDGKTYELLDCDMPTVNRDNPYELTPEEAELMDSLRESFMRSSHLKKHINLLLDKGRMYRSCNGNLMFHGCVPLQFDGSFQRFKFGSERYWGKNLFDFADREVRRAFDCPVGSRQREEAQDFMWWLWCGKNSPIFGRLKMTSFERMLIADKSTHTEPKNCYYKYQNDEKPMNMILEEFGLDPEEGHIINGHMPVKTKDGESPIKCNGKVMCIDGGFCKAYQSTTGIAGYTLIYNSYGLRLVSHGPFTTVEEAVENNTDILSISNVFERVKERKMVADTDIGMDLKEQVSALKLLLEAYRSGELSQKIRK